MEQAEAVTPNTRCDFLLKIPGSPSQYTVGQLKIGGGHKVQVGGPGLERGEVGLENFFVYSREAGACSLSIAIEGPGQATMKVEERPDGFLGVGYNVDKPDLLGFLCLYCTLAAKDFWSLSEASLE